MGNLPEINSESLISLIKQSRWYGGDEKIFRYGDDWKIYYVIGEWNNKNNIEDTISLYCKSFTNKDRVKLIVKTFHEDYTRKNINFCISKVEEILNGVENHPEVLLITQELSTLDTLFIHSIGDCYLTMTRGEGFCQPAFDAFNFGRDVIIPGFGSDVAYLGESYKGLVGYDLLDIYNKELNESQEDVEKWANPNIQEAVDKLRNYNSESKPKISSAITLKNGWYFVEQKNGIYYRYSHPNSEIEINDPTCEYVKFKIGYNADSSDTKTIEFLINDSIKKVVILNKGVSQFITIPVLEVKNIKISTYYNRMKRIDRNNLDLGDHRHIEFFLESVDLINHGFVTTLNARELCVENELDDFYHIFDNHKVVEEIAQQSLFLGTDFTKINISKLHIESDSRFGGITYIGQYGTSGYATAAKGNLCYFFNKGIPISWIPLHFDNSVLSDDCMYNIVVKSFINKPIKNSNAVILHSTPDLWPDFCSRNVKLFSGKTIIGYTVWETSRLPVSWVECINDSVEEVWCPSVYNKTVFKESGVNIPIKVFPHVFLRKELPERESVVMISDDGSKISHEDGVYTFYNISELNIRKGVEDLVTVFCNTFTSNDKVRLILKIHYRNYEEKNKQYCLIKLNEIIQKYEHPPRIEFLVENLVDREILALHSIGDCYVSLCKSEGFGLTIFEAFNYGKKIIVTGYSGHMDFLTDTYDGLIRYTIGKIVGMEEFSKNYTDDQEWAYPDLDHAGQLMKGCL